MIEFGFGIGTLPPYFSSPSICSVLSSSALLPRSVPALYLGSLAAAVSEDFCHAGLSTRDEAAVGLPLLCFRPWRSPPVLIAVRVAGDPVVGQEVRCCNCRSEKKNKAARSSLSRAPVCKRGGCAGSR